MDVETALELRMRSLLLRQASASVADVVTWFGAMQAQDVNSGLWSFGVRLPGFTADDVTAALERREAVRTWPMRGTVHFVPPADVHWMLDLTGVRALAGAEKRRATLGLDLRDAERAVEVLGAALAGGGRLTRAECLTALTEGGVDVSGQRSYHLLWYAAQKGTTVIAPHVGKEQTFVLLDEWVPKPNRPSRDEALAILALRYFRSHGPTTVKDFSGWTGLTMTDARRGVAAAGADLREVTVDGAPMVAAAAVLDEGPGKSGGNTWLALPGFDEYLLGFKDRSMMMRPEDLAAVIPGGNGMFRATIVRGGRVQAVWTRTLTRKGVTVTVEPLEGAAPDREQIVRALEPYAAYLELPLTVKNP